VAGKKSAKEDVQPSTSSGRSVASTAAPSGAASSSRGQPGAQQHRGAGAGPSSSHSGAPGASGGREKPGLPQLTDAALQHYYSEPLPSFRDVPPSEKQLLFVQKLHLCAFTFDFSDPSKHLTEKEVKRQTLLELVDYANSGQGKFTEAVSEDIVFMLSQNLFRTLPPTRSHDVDNFDPEEEEPLLEAAWPHLQVG